jgi:hypothetical protein
VLNVWGGRFICVRGAALFSFKGNSQLLNYNIGKREALCVTRQPMTSAINPSNNIQWVGTALESLKILKMPIDKFR